MYNVIRHDFQIPVVAENEESYFFAKTNKELFHFIFTSPVEKGYSLGQYYVHRFEIANWLYEMQENTFVSDEINVNKRIKVRLTFNDKEGTANELTSATLTIIYKDIPYAISLGQNPFGQDLIKDVELLTKIKQGKTTRSAKNKIKTALGITTEESFSQILTPHRFTIAAFEYSIMRSIARWQKQSSFYKLVRLEIQDKKEIDTQIVENLIKALPIVVNKTDCNCDDKAACFFDLLKTSYTYFFNESELLTDEEMDSEKVKTQFNQLWNQLSVKERVVLNYLHETFENTPLINLYLLVPQGDPYVYLYKMTYPYQPDSEDDAYVRKATTLALWYMQSLV
ncbi:MAG: hypothetical protein ACK4UP_08370 [Spirosomataceae bacterium]